MANTFKNGAEQAPAREWAPVSIAIGMFISFFVMVYIAIHGWQIKFVTPAVALALLFSSRFIITKSQTVGIVMFLLGAMALAKLGTTIYLLLPFTILVCREVLEAVAEKLKVTANFGGLPREFAKHAAATLLAVCCVWALSAIVGMLWKPIIFQFKWLGIMGIVLALIGYSTLDELPKGKTESDQYALKSYEVAFGFIMIYFVYIYA